MQLKQETGAVVIGRNEGVRLNICLESMTGLIDKIVYVDSGSTDGSVELANSKGVTVVSLDMTQPFTAARARNAGFAALIDNNPQLTFVQFIDGDCELNPHWLKLAVAFLTDHPDYVVVCGRRRERFPNHSVYNLLCDIEWNTPTGETNACGGDALMRIDAFKKAGGYRDNLIAGEEPELCFRLRQNSWRIYRLDAEMTLHDAAMSRFSQWWQRTKRAGFAFAEGSYLHGKSAEKYWVKETRSIVLWGGLLPAVLLTTGLFLSPWFLLGGLIYPLQIVRIGLFRPVDRNSRLNSLVYGFFVVLGKFPQAAGAARFILLKLSSKEAKLIEYK